MAPKLISSFFKTTTKLQADASMEREFDRSIANQRVRELDAPRGDEEEEERLENIGLDNILEVHEDAQGEEVSLV